MIGDPEQGLTFARRSAYKCHNFSAEGTVDFYSHALLEVVVNRDIPFAELSGHPQGGRVNPLPSIDRNEQHSRFKVPNVFQTRIEHEYFRYKYLNVMYGKDKEHIFQVNQIQGCDEHISDTELDGVPKFSYIPVHLPSMYSAAVAKDKKATHDTARYLWIDLTYPIRGMYFPVSFQASKKYTDCALYAYLDFVGDKKVEIPTVSIDSATGKRQTATKTYFCDTELGLGIRDVFLSTARIDLPGLVQFLCIPKGSRNPSIDPFKQFIKIFPVGDVKTIAHCSTHISRNMSQDQTMDYLVVQRNERGVHAQWDPPPPNEGLDIVHGILNTALGMIPYAGPILAFLEDAVYYAVADGDFFTAAHDADLISRLLLSVILDTALQCRSFIKQSKINEARATLYYYKDHPNSKLDYLHMPKVKTQGPQKQVAPKKETPSKGAPKKQPEPPKKETPAKAAPNKQSTPPKKETSAKVAPKKQAEPPKKK